MIRTLSIVLTMFSLFVSASVLWGQDCNQCHAAKGVKESIPDVAPIKMRAEGKSRSIALSDAFKLHGHSCPGMTAAYRALQYGILKLYGNEVPDREDLVIFSKTPTFGSLEFLDLIMIGENRTGKTSAPMGMRASRDNFCYTLYRKSTSTAVDIHLKPEHFPEDFFDLKKGQSSKKLNSEEWDKLHSYIKNIILTFPQKSFEDLFGDPQPYKMIFWGKLLPAHAESGSSNKN
jgi:hypothetical protein